MIGVIADDLTGAAELGGVGLRYGLKAEVVLHGECTSDAELVCVDTDSRSCGPREAGRRAAAAANELRRAGAEWIYKKVDSVMRGQVLAEVQAIQRALRLRTVLLAPANPGFGRRIRHGRYYVKGKLIHQTDFARDPEFPRTSSNVLEMLGPSAKHRVTVSRLDQQFPGTGIILGEVSSPVDLREWASRCSPNILPAGGAEFFAALLKTIAPAKRRASSPAVIASRRPRGSRELFICGSTSDSTRKFVSEAKSNGTPVFFVLDGAGEGFSFRACAMESMAQEAIRAFGSHSRVVLAIGRPLIERRAVAHRLARCLAEVAVLVLGKASPGHIYAEGGATAAELVRRLEWKRMGVMRELAPGVTTLGLPNRESPLLTIKPGSYAGWPK